MQQALAHRAAQDMEAAYAAILRADPNDHHAAGLRAQIALETGRPAADLFAAARVHQPDNPALIRGHAAALIEAGEGAQANHLLNSTLAMHTAWLDGHQLLANLRVTSGDPDFARSYAEAVAREPGNVSLRLAWFQALSVARDWAGARAVVEDAIAAFGDTPALRSARVYLVSESGEGADDPVLFDAVCDIADIGLLV